MAYVKKRHEECVLFLDEGFAAESVACQLREAGFSVQRFHDWFRDENGKQKQNVPDPEVIRFCHKKGWLLVSRDHEMKRLHREDIRRSEVAIVATANNKGAEQSEWVRAIITQKSRLLREFKKLERPWFAIVTRGGAISFELIR